MVSNPKDLGTRELSAATFDRFTELIRSETGIHMSDSKRVLVSNRLRARLRALRLESYEDYYDLLISGEKGRQEMPHFIDAISTNETYFFRGEAQFDALQRTILPELLSRRAKLEVWSAASATGEEAYSILIAALEAATAAGWAGRIEVMATDVSTRVLEAAERGLYSGRSLRKLSDSRLAAYFHRAAEGQYQIEEELRRKIRFRRHNLLKDVPPPIRFDIIFCRNVLMYFNRVTQKGVIERQIAPVLAPDGYLFIGSSESFVGLDGPFQYAHIDNCPIYTLKSREASSQ